MTEGEWQIGHDPARMLEAIGPGASDRKLRLFAVGCCRRIDPLLPDGPSRQLVVASEAHADGECEPNVLRQAVVAVLMRHEVGMASSAACEAALACAGLLAEAVTGWCPSGYDLWPVIAWSDPRLTVWAAARRAAHHAAWAAAWHADAAGVEQARERALEEVLIGDENPEWIGEEVVRLAGECAWANAYRAERRAQADLLRDIIGPHGFRRVQFSELPRSGAIGAAVRIARSVYDGREFERLPAVASALAAVDGLDTRLIDHLRESGPHVRGCWAVDFLLGKK